MNHKPLVSIIIPAFNAQKFVAETLDSVLAQTCQDIEIIVIDDGSTDQTSQIIQRYKPGVLHHYIDNSGGVSIPRNVGVKHSSGQFLCFLDADDLMIRDRIATQLDFMDRYPDVGLVFSDYQDFSTLEDSLTNTHFETCPKIWSQIKGQDEVVLENVCTILARENFGIAGSFMVRKSLMNSVGGFDPTLKACEDFHFYFRLARRTPVGIINKVGLLRRLHGHNMSSNLLKMLGQGIRSRSMLLDDERDVEVRKLLAKYIASCQRDMARHYADTGSYLQALRYDWQVLTGSFLVSEVKPSCRNIVRTLVLASGLCDKFGNST